MQQEATDLFSNPLSIKMKIYSHLNNQNLHYLQQWASPALDNMAWRETLPDLAACSHSIVILEATEASYYLEVTKKLIAQNNFLVLCDFFYSWSHGATKDIVDLCPEIGSNYAVISSADHRDHLSVNVNEFYHTQAKFTNRARGQSVLEQWVAKENKPYSFFYHNTRARPHRIKFTKQLLSRDLLHNALWNWEHYHYETDQEKHFQPDAIPFTQLPIDYVSPFVDADKIELLRRDRRRLFVMKDTEYQAHWSLGHLVPKQFVDTYFTVYSEGDIENQHINAVPYNALLSGHPMIILGAPGYLKHLHDMGFRTWHPVIDESYDSETDPDLRITKICDAIERLCSQGPERLLETGFAIGEHNRRHFVDNEYTVWCQTQQRLNQLFLDIKARVCRANREKEHAGYSQTQTD
jgi:hypothetical protein